MAPLVVDRERVRRGHGLRESATAPREAVGRGHRGAADVGVRGAPTEGLKRERTVGGWSLRKRVNCQLSNQPITRVDRYSLVFV
jgi:hypothetical protein